MKRWNLFLFFLIPSLLIATSKVTPPDLSIKDNEIEDEHSHDVTTPSWATDPIGVQKEAQKAPLEKMTNKHIAAVIISTAAAIAIGLIVSGNKTGKSPSHS